MLDVHLPTTDGRRPTTDDREVILPAIHNRSGPAIVVGEAIETA
jgi:hypothetical protein